MRGRRVIRNSTILHVPGCEGATLKACIPITDQKECAQGIGVGFVNKYPFIRVAVLFGLVAVRGACGNARTETDASPDAGAKIQRFMTGDLVFIENEGQWPDTSIKFALDSRGANVGLTDRRPRFQLLSTKPGLTPAERSGDGFRFCRADCQYSRLPGMSSPPSVQEIMIK